MRYHLLALVPIILGSIGELMGMQNAFLLGAIATGIGIAFSYLTMLSHAFGWAKVCASVAVFMLIIAGGVKTIMHAGDVSRHDAVVKDA